MKEGQAVIGAWVRGVMDAHEIPTKMVVVKSGVHESTFSRFVNGVKPVNDRQLVQIGIAIGEARAEQQQKRAVRS